MYGGTEALSSDVDVYDDALWFSRQSGIPIRHGQSNHLMWSVISMLVVLRLHTSLGQVMILGNWFFFSFWPLTIASMMEGWSLPRLTKTCATPYSHRASKKAKEAV